MTPLADLHCHLLPGIDDGAKTIQDTRGLLESSARQGIQEIVFTPHYYPERMDLNQFLKNRNRALQQIRPIAEELEIRFRVGAEIHFTPVLAELPLQALSYSGTRYLLLELYSAYEPLDVLGLIERLHEKGYTPILAHIERYPYVNGHPELLYQWVKAGALAQMNAGWILNNRTARKQAEKYVRWNLVHVIASDAHNAHTRPQNLADAYQRLSPEVSETLSQNAARIFAGETPHFPEPKRPERRFGHWI